MRRFLWGFVIGAVLAFFAGVNVGKDRPILSNPFADRPLAEQVRDTAGEMAERAGAVLEDAQRAGSEAAEDVQRSAGELADEAKETVVGEPKSPENAETGSEPRQ